MQKSNNKINKSNILLKLCLALLVLCLYGCSALNEEPPINNSKSTEQDKASNDLDNRDISDPQADSEVRNNPTEPITDPLITPEPDIVPVYKAISPEGMTLESRINPPDGYTRIPTSEGELSYFLRSFKLKNSDSPLLYYDGTVKANQADHVAIFDLDTGELDRQQCADSIIRIYAEYYWSVNDIDKIAFHLTNGFLMEYTKWRDGNRIVVDGNDVRWKKTREYDDSYECFRSYLNMVFAYAGTLSLSNESKPISFDELRPGDMFLQGGSPGHCVLVVDAATNSEGNRSFLFAQGYMPAQDFHVLKNPLHLDDPWYYENEMVYPVRTPAWTFEQDSLVRWSDFPLTGEAGEVPAISDNVLIEDDIKQLSLLAVGDNLIHIQVIKSGINEDGSYNYDHLYENIREDIMAADVAVINQETILGGDDFKYSGYPNFNSPFEVGEAVVNAGFDVVLHATNHTLDMGLKGVLNTFDFWKRYPEIKVLGINETEEQQDTIPIIEKNDIKLAMLNYTYGLNGHPIPNDTPYIVNKLIRSKMTSDIKKAKELADFVIVFPHWGNEYVYEPVQDQKNLVDFYYDLGVDLVIGTHPHVIEPVEWIKKNDDHSMLVYYSLGNFLSYQKEAPRMLGGIANITILKNNDNNTYIGEANITPIVTHYENGPKDYNYDIYKLTEYSEDLANIHGVSDIAKHGPLSYQETYSLADEVLGSWFD